VVDPPNYKVCEERERQMCVNLKTLSKVLRLMAEKSKTQEDNSQQIVSKQKEVVP